MKGNSGDAARGLAAPKRVRGKAVKGKLELFHWKDLPEYLKDNEFIVTGYRADTGLRGSLWSLFRLHNESGNVWSHLCGFLLLVALMFWMLHSPPTPMAMQSEDLESLWTAVSGRLDERSSAMMHQLYSIETGSAAHFDPEYAAKLFQDVRTNLTLQEGLVESLHSLEARAQELSNLLTQKLQTLSRVLSHPGSSLHNMSASLPHNTTEAVEFLKLHLPGVQPAPQANTCPKHDEALDPIIAAIKLASVSSDEAVSEESAQVTAAEPMLLQLWLKDVVSRSVKWPAPRWPFLVFMAGAMACLLFSAACHLLCCCSRRVYIVIWRLDYAGIVANIVCSFCPSVYYIFLCQPGARVIYLSAITVLGSATLLLTTLERFQHERWRPTRAGCFLALGLCGLVPWGHVLVAYPHIESVRTACIHDGLMGVAYVCAAAIFVLRVPEKWYPGRFDLFFNSHQIFHLLIVLGCYLHYQGTIILLRWRDASGGCALELTEGALVHQAMESGDRMLGVAGLVGTFQERLAQLWEDHQGATAQRMWPETGLVGGGEQCSWLPASMQQT